MSMSGQGQMNHVTYGQGYAPIGEVRELGDHKQAGVSTVSDFDFCFLNLVNPYSKLELNVKLNTDSFLPGESWIPANAFT